ncbi:carboxylic acid reductase [Rhodococcoides corynebacterioides]|uniref:carboxylic acid reductase n=1 Tax=Rhodococcoides corynebacterioides TaxID=53972 RepID=UPI000832475E|nr:carboxylic acid reductase [Rhodococcus corynebacterioides]
MTTTAPHVTTAAPDPAVSEHLADAAPDLHRMVETVMTEYADRPAVAVRARRVVTDESGRRHAEPIEDVATLTYADLWWRAGALARHLVDHVSPGGALATLGFASGDYVVAELATVRLGAVALPLQTGASVDRLVDIAAEAGPTALVVDSEHLRTAAALATRSDVAAVIVMNHDARVDDDLDRLAEARAAVPDGVEVVPLTDVLDRAAGADAPTVDLPTLAPDPDRLAALVYTSGSTGTPKGAMHTDALVARQWAATLLDGTGPFGAPEAEPRPVVTLDYLPMSHLAGRALVTSTLAAGGTVHFAATSDLSTLLEDFALARPTTVLLVPRVCDLVRSEADAAVDRRVRETGRTADDVRAEVHADLRERIFGGRVASAVVGTAPATPDAVATVSDVLGVPVHDMYGSTEAGHVLIDGVLMRPPVLEYRLEDVPELGYSTGDRPHPRGELLLRTASLTPGYYRRADATAGVMTDDGFYRTGDVFAEIGPDRLQYVDRRKNVVKLAQGEFVALSHLDAVYAASDAVDQIHVHGDGTRSYVLAVVVPAAGRTPRDVLTSLQEIARREGLASYEVPRDVVVADEPFTTANGLLSGANKQLRPAISARYADALEARYREIDGGGRDRLEALRQAVGTIPTVDVVRRAAAGLLGLPDDDVAATDRFTDLGGDSLSAVTFGAMLRDLVDVEVPVTAVVSPTADLADVAAAIDRGRATAQSGDTDSTLTFESVHGADPDEVVADDLTPDRVLGPDFQAAARRADGPREDVRTVLVTGATGYLGRFLLLDWLERMDAVDGRVVTLVRARSAEDARRRLDATFGVTGEHAVDPELRDRWTDLANRRLDIEVGDVARPRLGLSDERWTRLAQDVDHIVHPAAMVNHALPYREMFSPNVGGTAEVIRLAATHHLKPVDYLSTVAVAAGVEALTEDGDIRIESPRRSLGGDYANGYATSKWAGEVLLRNTFDAVGLPVTVFRSNMILAHPRWRGQVNVPDVFTRTLASVTACSLAPRTFYSASAGERPRAHYDGLPVDFTAAAIAELGHRDRRGYRTYHVVNPHHDGISWDTVIDWLEDAGVSVERIDDHDEWYRRFHDALTALPEPMRSHSVLPLIHAYREPTPPLDGSPIPAERFRAAVRESLAPRWSDIPHLGPDLVAKYVRDLGALDIVSLQLS